MNVYKSSTVVATGFVVGGWVVWRLRWVVVSVVCCKKKKCIRSKIKNDRWERRVER
jgi:uncharacterized membrane protein YciS (DUF1049 family)